MLNRPNAKMQNWTILGGSIISSVEQILVKKLFNWPNAKKKRTILGQSIIRSVEQILVKKMLNRPNGKIQKSTILGWLIIRSVELKFLV